MSREIRRVPKGWQHPIGRNGNYKPLFNGYNEAVNGWDEGYRKWQDGDKESWSPEGTMWEKREGNELSMTYEEWAGERPIKDDYMPEWAEEEKTHIQMYETTSEGTPISPVMATPEELARWLTDNKASASGEMTATYEEWLACIHQGYSIGGVYDSKHGFISGVAVCLDDETRKEH